MSQIHEAILSDRSIAGEYALRQHGCCASRLPDEVNQSAPDDHESQYEQNEAHRPGNHVRIVDEIKEVIFTAGHDLPKRSALDNLVVGQNMTPCQISASQQTDAGASMQRPIIRFDVIEKISEGNGIVSGQEHHGNAADAIGQAGVFFDDTPTIVRLLDGQISCCGARDPHEYRNSGVYEGLHLVDQLVAASAGMLPTPLSHVKPYAAATTDHTGCVHIGPAREIEVIAASGAKGPTEVVYLYIGPSPQTLSKGDAEKMIDEFEKAFFMRSVAETDARKRAYETAKCKLIAALATEGK